MGWKRVNKYIFENQNYEHILIKEENLYCPPIEVKESNILNDSIK